MSAPDTNTDKQVRQHRGPLQGMAVAVLFALVLLVLLVFFVVGRGGTPEGAAEREGEAAGTATDAAPDASGPSANDAAGDDLVPNAEPGMADPNAVTVPAETVTAPETGAGNPADTDPGESQAAEPLDPADGE